MSSVQDWLESAPHPFDWLTAPSREYQFQNQSEHNLNRIKSKYKYVYVYTLFERVNEIAIKQQPWKWEQIIEIRKMAKG